MLCIFLKIIILTGWVAIADAIIQPIPVAIIPNKDTQYSLINSVDFHPKENIFCAAYTHNNKVCLYKIASNGKPYLTQTLCNPLAQLKQPQHAAFSPDGKKIVAANWTDLSLSIFSKMTNGLFSETPAATIYFPKALHRSKPHGIAFSPCGNYLAVACGAASGFETGIALFKSQGNDLECISVLTHAYFMATPKGICFSPDGTHLLVSFCDPSFLSIYSIENEMLNPIPRQIIEGINTGLSRPEDVKISPDGTYCAVTNSDKNTITFYGFNKKSNSITDAAPIWTLRNPHARLAFPHGLAFSHDGTYLAITQFGKVWITPEGNILWNKTLPPQAGTINLYRMPNHRNQRLHGGNFS
jgi:WD40 repeat protein